MISQLLLDHKQLRFGTLEHDQSGWPVRKYLAAQFAADASAGPGNDYGSTLDDGTHRFMTNFHRRPAEKVVNALAAVNS